MEEISSSIFSFLEIVRIAGPQIKDVVCFIFLNIFCIIFIQGEGNKPYQKRIVEGQPQIKPESEKVMKVHIEFEHEWTLNEIMDYLHNMKADKYVSLSDSEYLELAACAESYLRQKFPTDEGKISKNLNEIAMEDIQHGIEDHLAGYAEENYIIYYMDIIREFLLEACKNLD